MLLTETWLHRDVDTSALLRGCDAHYTALRADRTSKKGGGVALIARKHTSPSLVFRESVPDAYDIICSDLFLGSVVRVVTAYRAPSCSAAVNLQLLKALSDLISCSAPCLVTGDFKFPEIIWSDTPRLARSNGSVRRFIEFCGTHKLHQSVRDATIGNNILDLVLTNRSDLVSNLAVCAPLGNSDHSTVHFNIDFVRQTDTII